MRPSHFGLGVLFSSVPAALCKATCESAEGATAASKAREREQRLYLIDESNGRRLEGILLRQVDPYFPYPALVGCALGPEELDYELVEAT